MNDILTNLGRLLERKLAGFHIERSGKLQNLDPQCWSVMLGSATQSVRVEIPFDLLSDETPEDIIRMLGGWLPRPEHPIQAVTITRRGPRPAPWERA